MKISNRLQTVASFVTKGSSIVDVGTDHGYVPIYLIEENIAIHAIAMDVRKGPLDRAKTHIEQFHLEKQIETRLSDGLKELKPNEADTLIITGMGGALEVRILEEGKHVLEHMKEIILSPQSELHKVRTFLQENSFIIIKEIIIFEDGKYYTIMKAIKGNMNYERYIDFKYGKLLLEEKNSMLKEFLEKERIQLEEVRNTLKIQDSDAAKRRILEVETELSEIMEAIHEML